jgi:hypothetical protein
MKSVRFPCSILNLDGRSERNKNTGPSGASLRSNGPSVVLK